MDCSPPNSSVHRISQARILKWLAISFFWGSFQPSNQTCVSCLAGGFFTIWATQEALVQLDANSQKDTACGEDGGGSRGLISSSETILSRSEKVLLAYWSGGTRTVFKVSVTCADSLTITARKAGTFPLSHSTLGPRTEQTLQTRILGEWMNSRAFGKNPTGMLRFRPGANISLFVGLRPIS